MAQLIAEHDRALNELKEAQETIQTLKEQGKERIEVFDMFDRSIDLEIHRETLLKETKTLYEKELDEYQKDLELAVRERDDLQEKVQENETLLASIKEEFEKHMTQMQAEGLFGSSSSCRFRSNLVSNRSSDDRSIDKRERRMRGTTSK